MGDRVFGPVPSRRLGRSLGVNNIPAKICSYSCVYCQVGLTTKLSIKREEFYPVETIVEEVLDHLEKLKGGIDYVTYVPDGEPTLDINLGKEVSLLKKNIETPLAIITNGSLLFKEDVRRDLMEFDLVSVKVDAVKEKTWRIVNRPHHSLNIDRILEGISRFAEEYGGTLITETMLIRDLNDDPETITEVADFISKIKPSKAYISIPTRPPTEKWVRGASEEKLVEAYEVFRKMIGNVELLTGYEGAEFTLLGDPIKALLATISVHPLRIDYALKILSDKTQEPRKIIEDLLNLGEIKIVEYRGIKFILRKLPQH